MIIRNAVESGKTLENTFIAVDSLENYLGKSSVEPLLNDQLMPERPLELKIAAEGSADAQLKLLAAAMARAMVIARENGSVSARIYAECAAENHALMDNLASLGFLDDDALVRMRRRIVSGPNVTHLPDGCVFIQDSLADPTERRFFLERAALLFKYPDPGQWLESAAAKPCFRRLLLTSRDGLAGELVCWAERENGVIGQVYTAPDWRRRGVATYLMDAARQYFYQCRVPEAVVDVRWRMIPAARLAATAGYRRSETLMRLPGLNLDAARNPSR